MGRIRTIKPEFPQSESVGRISRDARLLFLLLLTIVDDSGRARGSSRLLASLLYPYDTDAPANIERWLAELDREEMVRRYQEGDAVYLEMRNFQKHQKIDRPTESKLPPYRDASRILDESSRVLAAVSVSVSVSGSGGDREEDRIRALRPLSPIGDEQQHDLEVRTGAGRAGAEAGGFQLVDTPETGRPLRRDAVPYEKILAAWSEICPELPQPAIPTETRKTKLRGFWKRCVNDGAAKGMEPYDWMRGFFRMVAESDFLSGRTPRRPPHENFTCDLWWIIQPEKYAYLLEGRYDNRRRVG